MSELILEELNKLLSDSDKLWIIRKRKINTKILFGIMSKVLVKNNGIKHVLAYNNYFDNSCNISDVAICKARNKCCFDIFDKIKNNLISKFTKRNNIYAVDGSKFHMPNIFSKIGFTTRSPTSHRILGMISTIFDVNTKIPINTLLSKHHNERTSICQQLKFIPKQSILIFDRGYYSKKMIHELENSNIKYLFRLKKDANNQIKKFYNRIKSVNKKIHIGRHQMRIFKYTINGKIYLCGTNINSSINYLKNLYKKRWTVEEGFKTMKTNLCFKKIHSKTLNLLKQEISIRELIFVITRLIQIKTKITKKKKNYKPSFKLALDFIINIDIGVIIDKIGIINIILCNNQFKTIPNRCRKILHVKI